MLLNEIEWRRRLHERDSVFTIAADDYRRNGSLGITWNREVTVPDLSYPQTHFGHPATLRNTVSRRAPLRENFFRFARAVNIIENLITFAV